MSEPRTERITRITLDETSMKQRSPEAEHERKVAIADLLGDNCFEPRCMKSGPYEVGLGVSDGRLILDVFSPQEDRHAKVVLSVAPLRGIIRDYFIICESYYDAIKNTSSGKLEAIDMGRRGVHNEGSQRLIDVLSDRIIVDLATARRLFTLICVLHIK
jgi:uncharacterized protein (UPF0262 family)